MPEKNSELKDPREWVKDLDIESTEDIAVPKMLVDQVIGQEQGVEISMALPMISTEPCNANWRSRNWKVNACKVNV